MTDVDSKVFHFTGMPFTPEGLWPMRLAIRDGVPSYKIREHLHGAGSMTRAAKLNRLSVLGHLGHSPHPLFATLLDLPGPELLHALQKGLRA